MEDISKVKIKPSPILCPICKSDDLLSYLKLKLTQCQECLHVWQSDLAPTQNYGEAYCSIRYDNEASKNKMAYLRMGCVMSTLSLLFDEEGLSYNI